eukprot:7150683-Pyramimonas_sp.AAC.1
MSRSDVALAPLRALAELSFLRVRSGRPYGILPAHAPASGPLYAPQPDSLAGSPAGVVSAGAPATSA